MTKPLLRIATAVLLVGGLWGSQRAIDRAPERVDAIAERPMAGLPAGQVVGDYVGALFLGGFRALVVDALWLRVSKLEEQDQFNEMLATTEMIVRLQPHFAKVWEFQANNMAYNISWQQEDRDQRFAWIEQALRLLEEAKRRNPRAVIIPEQIAYIYYHRIPFEEYLKRRVRQKEGKECHELAIHWYQVTRKMAMDEGARAGRPLDYLINYWGSVVQSWYELGLTKLGLAVAAARRGEAAEARLRLDEAEKALLQASQESSLVSTCAGDPTFWRNRATLYREIARSRTVLAPCLLDTTRAWVEQVLSAPGSPAATWPVEVFASAQRVIRRWPELSTESVQWFVMQAVLDTVPDAFALWDAGREDDARKLLDARAAFCEGYHPSEEGWKEFAFGLRSLEKALAKEKEAAGAAGGGAIAREEARRIYHLFVDRSLRLDVDRILERINRLPK